MEICFCTASPERWRSFAALQLSTHIEIVCTVTESLVSRQLKVYFQENNILNGMQSGLRSGHSTVSATLKVLNDIHCALDKKLHCVSVFIDFIEGF